MSSELPYYTMPSESPAAIKTKGVMKRYEKVSSLATLLEALEQFVFQMFHDRELMEAWKQRALEAESSLANTKEGTAVALEALAYHAELFEHYDEFAVAYEAVGEAANYPLGKPIIRAEAIRAAVKASAKPDQ